MRIVLVRHGKPATVRTTPICGHDIGQWVRQYNEVGITTDLSPPKVVRDLASSARYVVASDLARARESATWLARPMDVRLDPEMREAALPESLGIPIRLPPGAWVVIARVVWWLNWCEADESISMTRQRAGRVADRLAAFAKEHSCVMQSDMACSIGSWPASCFDVVGMGRSSCLTRTGRRLSSISKRLQAIETATGQACA